jgi:hypothetical protein
MRAKDKKEAPKAAYVAPAVGTKATPSLATIEREIARIQKKLGMDFSWYKAK